MVKRVKIYLDVESSGLKGKLNLVQLSVGQGNIETIRPYREPNKMETLKTVLDNKKTIIVGFNVGFDILKLYQFYQPKTRFKCSILDLRNHLILSYPISLYTVYSKRSLIRVAKVPIALIEITKEIIIEKMRKIILPGMEIKVKEEGVKKEDGMFDENFKTLIFSINFSTALKSLVPLFAPDLKDQITKIEEVFRLPTWKEDMVIPFPTSDEEEKYNQLWKENEKILDDPNSQVWKYAKLDVKLLWRLENWLKQQRNDVVEDINDICTHSVAFTRYLGFRVDIEKTKKLILKFENEIKGIKEIFSKKLGEDDFNLDSSPQRLKYLKTCSDFPQLIISSSRDWLEKTISDDEQAIRDGAETIFQPEKIPEIEKLLSYKPLCQRLNQLKNLLLSPNEKTYPNFSIIGTSTGRMSGRDGFNFQGVSRDGEIRELILTSQGGDFSALEIRIGAAVDQDDVLLSELKNKIDPHTMSAVLLFKDLHELNYEDYNEIIEAGEHDLKVKKSLEYKKLKEIRGRAKAFNFALRYGATVFLLSQKLELSQEETEKRMEKYFFSHYLKMKESQDQLRNNIEVIKFDESHGYTTFTADFDKMISKVTNLYGEIRYCLVEKEIARWLFENKNIVSKRIQGSTLAEKTIRRNKNFEQTMSNAMQSAFVGAAANILKSLYRQLLNARVQSSAATLTKRLQARLFTRFGAAMMQIHDEIIFNDLININYHEVKKEVETFIKEESELVPTLKMDWKQIKNWSEK